MRAVLSHEFRQEEVGDAQPTAIIREFHELVGVLDGLRASVPS
jgi:hypothetical protein